MAMETSMSKKHYAYYDAPKPLGNHGSFDSGVMPGQHKKRMDLCTSRPIRMGTVERTSKSRSFVPAKREASVYWDDVEDREGNVVGFKRKLNIKSLRSNVANWKP